MQEQANEPNNHSPVNHSWRSHRFRLRCRNVAQATICAGLVAVALLWPAPLAQAKATPDSGSKCLASAIYHEARGEKVKAQRAVLDVVMNRMVESGKSACEVLAERRQFPWHARKGWKPYNDSQRELLSEVLTYPKVLKDEKFKWFYSGGAPGWAKDMTCRRISRLTFCKEKK
jgi:hypothetical protein